MKGLAALLSKLRLPPLQGGIPWVAASVLFGLGLITSLVSLSSLSTSERARAMETRQRYVIDPSTGAITLGAPKEEAEKEEGFDVATDEPAPPKAEEPATEAEHAPEAATEAEKATPEEPTTAETPATEPDTTEHKPEEKTEAAPGDEHATAEHPTAAEPSSETPVTPEAIAPTSPEPAPKPEATASSEAPVKTEEATPSDAKPAETPAAKPADDPKPAASTGLRTEPITVNLTAPTRTKDSLVMAPAPEVTEEIDGMKLPKRGDKDVTPAKLYAHPFERKPDQVLISFVVLDAGLDPQSIGLIMALPNEVSIAYSPYGVKRNPYTEHLRASGHELWAMVPTMNDSYPADDPGPMGLVSRMPAEEIQRRTRMILAALPGTVGLVLPANETLSLHGESLKPALDEMETRGLLMMTANIGRPLDQLTRDEKQREHLRRADIILDPEPDETQIRSKLAGLLATAKEKGELMVVLSARPQTLTLLSEWLQEVKLEAPMALAPLSAMYVPSAAPEAAPAEEGGGHGAPEKKKEKKKPAEKKQKPLPQDKYLKPAGDKKEGGGHGGGGH